MTFGDIFPEINLDSSIIYDVLYRPIYDRGDRGKCQIQQAPINISGARVAQ
jgi:hypothetical protein